MNDNLNDNTKEEVDSMAVFSKPCNFSFQVSEDKSEAFLKNDTRPAFRKAMEQFKKHGGKVQIRK